MAPGHDAQLFLSGLTEACSKQPLSLETSTERFVNQGAPSPILRERSRKSPLFPIPPAGAELVVHVGRGRGDDADRLLVSGDRHHDLAGMQMQLRLPEARAVAVNVIAEDRPSG